MSPSVIYIQKQLWRTWEKGYNEWFHREYCELSNVITYLPYLATYANILVQYLPWNMTYEKQIISWLCRC